ncbi:MAG: ESPR-type extended signal peptide-containing protein, partial [Phascolarctobacterium succinatutens]|uniref:ESPR-type extended signal peptide-containing protein n=1 Tax=Phascolarctobacterium succinatutens TaxID=626940 RepID=UPI002E75B6B9
MNKIFKVIWNEARNAYVVVSEIAKNHGSKSCSTKKLLAMLIATGVMTCASFDVLAAKPAAEKTAAQQYVALKAKEFDTIPSLGTPDWKEYKAQRDGKKEIGGYTYRYDETNKYWVREGYVLTVDENGGKYTPLSENAIRADVAYKDGVAEGILQSVTSTVSASGTVTNMGESLNKITAGSFAGVSHAGGTAVEGSWDYIIKDASWEGEVDSSNYEDGYVNLYAGETATAPKGFVNTDSKDLIWDDSRQAYFYKNQRVDYSNMYVINGKLGVFTNADSTKVYTGTVYGKNNEILMTVKDKDNNFYSYWAAEVTDPSATMATYRVEEYNKNLANLVENDDALNRNDIKKVTLTNDENSATIGLMRNGGNAVDGAITVTSGGGTGGSGAAHDTFVKISNGTTEQTFATGSKVEAIVDKGATTGIKINGEAYTIKSGSKVSVTHNAAEKTTTITVDDTATTITDTDTTYTEGDGIEISDANAISVSKNLTGMQSINGAGGTINLAGSAITVNKITFNKDGRIQNVANGTETKDAVNFGQLQETNNKVDNLTTEVGKGWTVATENGTATKVGAGDTVKFSGDDNIVVSNTGKNVVVKLGKELTGLTSVTTNNAYVTKVDASKNESVTNVEYVKNQIADAALSAGKGISITDKKINVKLKDGEENLKVDETGLYLRKDLTGITSITGAGEGAGRISFANDGIKFNNKVTIDNNGKISGVANGIADTDVVNVGQLNAAVQAGNTDTHIKAGEYGVGTDNKVNMQLVDKNGKDAGTVTITDVAKASDVGDVNNIADDIKNGEGHTTVVEAVNNLNNKVGDLQYSKVEKGDIVDGDSTTTAIGKLDQKLTDVEATAAKHTKVEGSSNIIVTNTAKEGEAANYKVELKKDIDVDTVKATTVTTGQTVMNNDGVKVGKDVSVTATAVTAGKTSISDEGAKVDGKTYISANGLNANDKKVTNVADGKVEKDSKDAINGGQLHQAKADINNRIDGVENQVISNSNRINQLGSRVNKVGAGAAALAALHPMDFDPDDKLTFSAGYGNYAGENAAAIGAYYRP